MKIIKNPEGHRSNCDLFKGYNPTTLPKRAEKSRETPQDHWYSGHGSKPGLSNNKKGILTTTLQCLVPSDTNI